MIKKNIKRHIEKKLEDWIKSIDDKKLQELVRRDVIVTGGCFVSLLLNTDVNDYDIYFATKETAMKVAEYYTKKHTRHIKICENYETYSQIKEKMSVRSLPKSDEDRIYVWISDSFEKEFMEYKNNLKAKQKAEKKRHAIYEPVFFSENAITLSDDIQIILRFFGSPEEIHKNYDFSMTTNYYHGEKLVLNPEAVESILTKEMKYIGSRYPICSLFRLRKYIERGFMINAGQILKIAWQINKLNLNDINVLKDQLIGVDSLFFYSLIVRLKNHEGNIDYSVICQMIDEIFNNEE